MARHPKEINQNQFEQACMIQCTMDEMCALFDVDRKTLIGWCRRTYNMDFSTIYKIKSQLGKMSLRRTIFTQAQKGNTACLLFMSKNYLGLRDNPPDNASFEASAAAVKEENKTLLEALSNRDVSGVDDEDDDDAMEQ